MIAVLLPVGGNRTYVTVPEDILITIAVLSKYLSNSISNVIAEWYKAVVVRMSSGTVTWVRFPPTGKRTAITKYTCVCIC